MDLGPRLDVYETVGMDGEGWDLLYLSMYYPAKSKEVPLGLRKAPPRSQGGSWFRGTNIRCDDFPAGIYPLVIEASTKLVGMGLADPRIKECPALRATRPIQHREFLKTLQFEGTTVKAAAKEVTAAEREDKLLPALAEILVACAVNCREAILTTTKDFETAPKRNYWYEALSLPRFS